MIAAADGTGWHGPMRHYSIMAPELTNESAPAPYVLATRGALRALGLEGWHETPGVGVWRGRAEEVRRFDVYVAPGHDAAAGPPGLLLRSLARQLRRAWGPEQEAIQVSYHGVIDVTEG